MVSQTSKSVKLSTVLWLIYILFIIYGTTIPFNIESAFQTVAMNLSEVSWIPFIDHDGSRASIPDIVQNILLFLPFGFLGFFSLKRRFFSAILVVTIFGLSLSLAVEMIQLLTIDRTSSMTDIVTNSIGSYTGAALGASSENAIEYFMKQSKYLEYYRIKFFYPLLICCVFIFACSLHPFDFSLGVSALWHKLKAIIKDPLVFSADLRDEPLFFMRYFLFSFLWSLCLWEWKASNPVLKGVIISVILGFFLESVQLIIISRMPTAQDMLVILCGSVCGGLFIEYWPFVFSGRNWSLLTIMATAISAAIFSLSPFQWAGHADKMNWFPFLPYYEITTFIALSNFIESFLIYFPMGFILQYFNNYKKTYAIALLVALAISFPLEYSQKWIVGRYPDITDVIGAFLGALSGAIVSRDGWKAFTNYIEAADSTKEMNSITLKPN